jgi:hypothetical protein
MAGAGEPLAPVDQAHAGLDDPLADRALADDPLADGAPFGAAAAGATARDSVAGSTVSERAREVLADDADLVDPDVADPDLVGLDVDGDTRTDLGLPPEPRPAPTAQPTAQPTARRTDPADAPAQPDDIGPVETDSEATVTIPVGSPGRGGPPGTPRPPARGPASGAYGGDADLRTQRIAPLPFGPSAGTQAEQQPARAFRPQPPASPLDFQDERPRGDRRKRGLAALAAVLGLVVVVLIAGFLLVRGLVGGGADNRAGSAPPPSASLGPAAIPSGYTRYAGTGFTVGVPAGWPPQSGRDGVVDAREPGSTRFLRLITVDSTTSALDQLTAAEKQFAANPSYGAYQRVKLGKVDYRGLDAADWEFTFTLDGVPRHVLYRGIVTGGRTYGLYLSTPADQWAKTSTVFQVAATTFRTS